MGDYKYNNPDDAYKEAQRRIKKAKDESATGLSLVGFGDLNIRPGALSGDSLDSRMRELVGYAGRNGRFPDLVTEIANQRPYLFADSKRPRS